MKKNKTIITIVLVLMTVSLIGFSVYISGTLSSSSSPTQIRKTKAADLSYSRTVPIADISLDPPEEEPTITDVPKNTVTLSPTKIPTVTVSPVVTKTPTATPALLAQAPTVKPTVVPTLKPTQIPTLAPTKSTSPTTIPLPSPTPTMQPLLAYKSTSISPTMSPTIATTKTPSPTKKIQPTGVQTLPETGWIQTSSILFIVAASTILFSLLF